MSCSQCEGTELQFDAATARRELKQYQRRGPRKTTRVLVDALRQEGVAGRTLLDIGGGVGAIQFELLEAGVRHATGVDAASAYVHVVREEAARRGYAGRVEALYGDFVEVAPRIEAADIVTLDRVVCCYPDVEALVDASASRARMWYALVYPRDARWMTPVRTTVNFFLRVRRIPMQFFVHASDTVDAAIRRHGFTLQMHRRTPLWQVAVYRRQRIA
jgi:predicted TPR repeat methyltransferase